MALAAAGIESALMNAFSPLTRFLLPSLQSQMIYSSVLKDPQQVDGKLAADSVSAGQETDEVRESTLLILAAGWNASRGTWQINTSKYQVPDDVPFPAAKHY